jgi:hypothetical protein
MDIIVSKDSNMTDVLQTPTAAQVPTPSKEMVDTYTKNIHDEIAIEARVKVISDKLDVVYRDVFKIGEAELTYVCFFKRDNTITFKVILPSGNYFFLPSMPVSCLYDDADLHINVELVRSDLSDEFNKIKKVQKELEEKRLAEETGWTKFWNLFRF